MTDIDDYVKGLESVFNGKATILHRMRLSCTFHDQEGRDIGSDADGKCCSLFLLVPIFPGWLSSTLIHLSCMQHGKL